MVRSITLLILWIGIGTGLWLFSDSYRSDVCQFNESNFNNNRYETPNAEHIACLDAYDGLRFVMVGTAYAIGCSFICVGMYVLRRNKNQHYKIGGT